jgi:hypothetical protein
VQSVRPQTLGGTAEYFSELALGLFEGGAVGPGQGPTLRLMWYVSIDIADWYSLRPFRRRLFATARLRPSAMAWG